MPTIHELYESVIRDSLFARENEVGLRDLICCIQGYDEMSDFYLKKNAEIADLPLFQSLLARFLNGEPVQYLTNNAHFMGRRFYVDQRVLIPRMETEEVVGIAIKKIRELYFDKNIVVADIGTGSGAIAISLKKEFASARVIASDTSLAALEVAKTNAAKHKTEIQFLSGNGLEPYLFNGLELDVIVSNPPYITNISEIDASVIAYEPYSALVDESDMAFYKNIFKLHQTICRYPFLMIFEIGHDMRGKIESEMKSNFSNAKWEIIQDINKNDRILSIYIEKE
ncbi:MAG: peptide chain release factor N(5)-glutamine methyltransferase [Bacilli bacterium]|jgi:release factor glutamine methyltransferase